jgi:hypothetical protein
LDDWENQMKSLRKTRDANKGLPVSRKQSRTSFRPVGQAHRASFSENKPDIPWVGSLTFVEDFTGEHSFPGLPITLIEILRSF